MRDTMNGISGSGNLTIGCASVAGSILSRDTAVTHLYSAVTDSHGLYNMFCLLCALSWNSSLRDAKPAGYMFVWFAKHSLAKHCLSFLGDADECEKQFCFVFRICLAFFDVRLRWALVHLFAYNQYCRYLNIVDFLFCVNEETNVMIWY